MARPKIEIDYELIDKLCAIQCTGKEIAGILNTSYDTLSRRIKEEYGIGFAEYFELKGATGRVSLRRKQWDVAMKGNIQMLIWLGKQYLGQTDKQEISGLVPLKFETEIIHGNKKTESK